MLEIVALVLAAVTAAPRPYDERADARAEIARMLECARDERKPLLVMFGANWCPWCRKLDRLLATDAELAKLADSAVLRLNVDIGQYDRNLDVAAGYGVTGLDDTGIPMLVVLRPDGSVREVKNSEDFVAGARYDRARIRRFLGAYVEPSRRSRDGQEEGR
jgi:protein disulfide-isomerase